jgi:hypothetical protein
LTRKNAKGEDGAKAGRPSPDPPAAPTQFERFEEFARRIVSVPKAELQEQERIYRERRREPPRK